MASEGARWEIPRLVRQLADNHRSATANEAARIRSFYAERGLPQDVTNRVLDKHRQHVEERGEWPADTSPDDYLVALRETLADEATAIYVAFEEDLDDWVVYFVGRVHREWRGRRAGQRIVVLFRRDPQRWITGFQARDGDVYVSQQGGHWVYRPR